MGVKKPGVFESYRAQARAGSKIDANDSGRGFGPAALFPIPDMQPDIYDKNLKSYQFGGALQVKSAFNRLGMVYQTEPSLTGDVSGPLRMSAPVNRKFVRGFPYVTGGTMSTTGDIVASGAYSTGGLGSLASDPDSNGNAAKVTTGATATNFGLLTLGVNNGQFLKRGLRPYAFYKIRIGTITDVRLWLGNFSADPGTSDTNTGLHYVGVRFSTSAGDTTFKLCSANNGGSSTATTIPMPAVAADTLYQVEIWDDGVQPFARVNFGDTATHTTNLPSTSQSLASASYGTCAKMVTLANAAKNFSLYGIYYEEN